LGTRTAVVPIAMPLAGSAAVEALTLGASCTAALLRLPQPDAAGTTQWISWARRHANELAAPLFVDASRQRLPSAADLLHAEAPARTA
jgi:hypothetical protein